MLDPEQQAEAGRRGSRVLNHDGDVVRRVEQRLEAVGRFGQARFVIDKGEIAPVVRHEHVVLPPAGHGRLGQVEAMLREKTAVTRTRDQVGVEAENDVRLGVGAFELDAPQERGAVPGGDEIERAVAFRLEGFLHRRAGAVFGDEAVIGVDGERRPVLR